MIQNFHSLPGALDPPNKQPNFRMNEQTLWRYSMNIDSPNRRSYDYLELFINEYYERKIAGTNSGNNLLDLL